MCLVSQTAMFLAIQKISLSVLIRGGVQVANSVAGLPLVGIMMICGMAQVGYRCPLGRG